MQPEFPDGFLRAGGLKGGVAEPQPVAVLPQKAMNSPLAGFYLYIGI
jgi:hypothetical protein